MRRPFERTWKDPTGPRIPPRWTPPPALIRQGLRRLPIIGPALIIKDIYDWLNTPPVSTGCWNYDTASWTVVCGSASGGTACGGLVEYGGLACGDHFAGFPPCVPGGGNYVNWATYDGVSQVAGIDRGVNVLGQFCATRVYWAMNPVLPWSGNEVEPETVPGVVVHPKQLPFGQPENKPEPPPGEKTGNETSPQVASQPGPRPDYWKDPIHNTLTWPRREGPFRNPHTRHRVPEIKPPVIIYGWRLLNRITEWKDHLNALYDGLPKKCKKQTAQQKKLAMLRRQTGGDVAWSPRYKQQRPSPQEMAKAIYECGQRGDISELDRLNMAKELLKNEIEDYLLGKAGKESGKLGRALRRRQGVLPSRLGM